MYCLQASSVPNEKVTGMLTFATSLGVEVESVSLPPVLARA